MELKHRDLMQNIDRGEISPVYLFLGEEDFLKEEAVDAITSTLIPKGAESFCLDIFSGDDTDGATIVRLAHELPMLGERRVVIVRNVERLAESDARTLADYVRKPSANTCLVLIAPQLGRTSALREQAAQTGTVVIFWPLFDNQVPGWLHRRAELLGKTISRDGCSLLQDAVGNGLRDLANELEKLSVYVGERKRIERQDVEAVASASRAANVYNLAEAISEQDVAKALRICGRMMQAGDNPIGTVAILTGHLCRLTRAGAIVRQGGSAKEIAAALGVRTRHAVEYANQAPNFSEDQLKRCFELLYRADIALKSSVGEPRIVMDFLVSSLCDRLESEVALGLFPVESEP